MSAETSTGGVNHNPWQEEAYKGPRVDAGPWSVAFSNALPKIDRNPDLSPILFAHGAAFNWEVWQQTGALRHLRDAGHRTLAVDLPPHGNFGMTRTTGPAMADPVEFWETMLERFRINEAISVFPSQSAPDLAFPILRKRPDTLSGIVLVDPVKVAWLKPHPDVPALVVWNKSDPVVAAKRNAAAMGHQFNNATIAIMDGNTHAPYIERPRDFNQLIEWFGRDPATASQRIGEVSMLGVQLTGVGPGNGPA